MTLPNGIVTRRRDSVAGLADITVDTGTEDVDYPATNLVDDNPAKVAKIVLSMGSPAEASFLFDYDGVKQPVEIAAIIHHDLDEGCDVVIQGNDANTWGSPSFEAAFTIPAWLGSGTRRWPPNVWLDLTEQTGYDVAGFKFWRILISNNSQDIEIGQILFYADRLTLDPDLRWGMDDSQVQRLNRPLIANVTRYSVETIYAMGTVLWSAEGRIRATDNLTAALVEQWHDAGGRELPWLVIPNGQENVCYFVRYDTDIIEIPNQFTDWHDLAFRVKEVARGLRPGV